MLGRLFKIFLPVIIGLILVVSAMLSARPQVSAGDWGDGGDWEECEDGWGGDWDWRDEDWDGDWDGECEEPSPSPSPLPCPDERSLLNFLNVYASDDYHDGKPSPTPCPTPTPTPPPPPVGGGPSGEGGVAGGPQCPTDRPQQVDQVWFTDKKPGEVTVHWANKGDAWGFQIAYGPSKDNLIWGVEVSDSKATQFTLKDLPDGELWVSVIAKSSKDCGGPASEPRVVGQVLAAAGIANSALLSLAGAGLISLGLWQAQRGLRRGSKKA